MDYSAYGNYGSVGTDPTSIIAGIFAALGIFIVVILALVILALVAKYKLFKKMGLDGWKGLIPMVSNYLQMEKTGVDQRWLLVATFGSIISIVPLIGSLALLVAMIYMTILVNVSLANSFGKSTGFAVGLILLNPIFLCILAFGSATYEGAKPMNDIIFKKTK